METKRREREGRGKKGREKGEKGEKEAKGERQGEGKTREKGDIPLVAKCSVKWNSEGILPLRSL